MSATVKGIALNTWAGRHYYAVEVVGETPKKTRIRILTPGGVMLPGRRYGQRGEIVLVPKHAICAVPAESHEVNGQKAGTVKVLLMAENADDGETLDWYSDSIIAWAYYPLGVAQTAFDIEKARQAAAVRA